MIGGFGGCALDRIHSLSHWPEPEQTTYIRSTLTVPGGMTLNALIAAARLGAPASYLGGLGDDAEGDFLKEYLRREGVDTVRCPRIPGGETPSSQVMTDPAGRRTIFHKRGIREAPRLKGGEPRLEDLTVLLLDGSWMESALDWAEEAAARQIPIVLDLSPNNTHPLRDRLLELADYAILSEEAAARISGLAAPQEQARALCERCGPAVIVTAGSQGCWCAASEESFQTPAFPVRAVDTTGAGDTFHGAFAAALYHKKSLGEAIRWASATAALKCTRPGHEGLPGRPALEEFLRTLGNNRP